MPLTDATTGNSNSTSEKKSGTASKSVSLTATFDVAVSVALNGSSASSTLTSASTTVLISPAEVSCIASDARLPWTSIVSLWPNKSGRIDGCARSIFAPACTGQSASNASSPCSVSSPISRLLTSSRVIFKTRLSQRPASTMLSCRYWAP